MVEFINSPAAAAAKLPFSQAVRVGDVLYLSGAVGTAPGTMDLVSGGIGAEARQAMENIGAVLRENGLTFDDVFKCTVMLADMSQWADFNAAYVTYFQPDRLPARSAFGASGLALGALVEVECMAHIGAD
jgi:2-iminobutanoate/2-iminopropanoate deaminase